MPYFNLPQYIKNLCEFLGGEVEENGNQVLETVLPEQIHKPLNLDEYLKLYFDSRDLKDDGYFINYESSLLESLSGPIKDKIVFSRITIPNLYLKGKGLDDLIRKRIHFINSSHRFLGAETCQCAYMNFDFKYAALSEEKKEGLIPITLNEYNLSRVNNIHKTCVDYEYKEGVELPGNILPSLSPARLYEVAAKGAERSLKEKLADFQKSLNHRYLKDVKRLGEYFGDIIREIERKIERKNLTGNDRKKELSRLDFTKKELEIKTIDQKMRYEIKVKIKAISALRIVVPAVAIKVLLRCKKKSREFIFIWNPLIKDLELPVCQKCYKSTSNLLLDENTLENTCQSCFCQ